MHRYGWLCVFVGICAYAQDPFEIVVFEYEPLPLGAYTYEAHMNYTLDGTKGFVGPVAPTQNQFHFTSEWTAGINDEVRFGVAVLSAAGPGIGPVYAGVRILPHFYAPRSWNLPLNLGFVAEFSLERPLFEENTRQLEFRGIVEKHIGRLQMDGNIVFERALHGPGTQDGWVLEPVGRIGWQAFRRFTTSVEYYGSVGNMDNFLPPGQQMHMLLPGGDWKISERVTWSFGVGLGVTDASSRVVLKSRLEFEFGRRHD